MNTELLNSLTVEQKSELLNEMRGWIKDCQWADIDDDSQIDEMSEYELTTGVEDNYSGGVEQFIKDNIFIFY